MLIEVADVIPQGYDAASLRTCRTSAPRGLALAAARLCALLVVAAWARPFLTPLRVQLADPQPVTARDAMFAAR